MIDVLIAAGLFAVLVWLWRGRSKKTHAYRLVLAFGATLAAAAALVAGARGAWGASLGLIAASAMMAKSARGRVARHREPNLMTLGQARSILGVGPNADAVEIQEAYRRLMRRVHPDVGGATGLAAQVNAARERLLR